MQFIALALLLVSQLASIAPVSPMPVDNSKALLVRQTVNATEPSPLAVAGVATNLYDLDTLTAPLTPSNTTSALATRADDDFHSAGLLDSLSGLPIVGGLLPVVGGLLKAVISLLPIGNLPIIGPILGALDVNGSAAGTNGTAPAPARKDPIEEAANVLAASDLLDVASHELKEIAKAAESLISKQNSSEKATTSSAAPTTTTTPAMRGADVAAADEAPPSASPSPSPSPSSMSHVDEFSFSGRVGSS